MNITRLDQFVGQRLRDKRLQLQLKKNDLASKIELSHQQIQKHEKGQSRISASVLFQLSCLMGVKSNYFFEGLESVVFPQNDNSLSDSVQARSPHLHILIIEDDPANLLLLRRTIEKSPYPTQIHAVHNGTYLLDFLRNTNRIMPFPRPDIILMDLHLSNRDGHHLHKETKRDAPFKISP
jgi:transcriptional regulator with XRE-family HTH domain